MVNLGPTLVEIDQRIADIRENLRELVEQAAAFSGAGDEERVSQRIADQQAQLDRLTKEREDILRQKK
jgi:enolase